MKPMRYKGYTACIEYSDEDHCFVGRIAGIRDVIGFHGDSVDALWTAFQEAVDDYLDACEKLGRSPNRPYSGKIMLRVSPELHAKAAMMAQTAGKSLNQWTRDLLKHGVQG